MVKHTCPQCKSWQQYFSIEQWAVAQARFGLAPAQSTSEPAPQLSLF